MRTILILLFALILPSGEAFAASQRFSATGCVRPVGKCMIIRSKRGDYFLLGRNLRAASGKRVTVKGTVQLRAKYVCPTRLIIDGNVRVTSWKARRGSCQTF
jgi:hypothetical protein